jgi:hypothetical protein
MTLSGTGEITGGYNGEPTHFNSRYRYVFRMPVLTASIAVSLLACCDIK